MQRINVCQQDYEYMKIIKNNMSALYHNYFAQNYNEIMNVVFVRIISSLRNKEALV